MFSLPSPKTFMLMELGEAHQPSEAWQQKKLGLSLLRGLCFGAQGSLTC